MKRKYRKVFGLIGIIMLAAAVVFVWFALNHPELSFPWQNSITFKLYGAYLTVMLICLVLATIRGKDNKKD